MESHSSFWYFNNIMCPCRRALAFSLYWGILGEPVYIIGFTDLLDGGVKAKRACAWQLDNYKNRSCFLIDN